MTGAGHGGLGAGPALVGGGAIGKKLKDLKEKVSKVDFYHLKFGEEPNKIHGWISPEGHYHGIDPKTHHKEWIKGKGFENAFHAHKAGWIEAGTGGLTEVSAHSSVMANRAHPAVRKLREMVGQHWPGDFQVHFSDKPSSLHTADTEHFSRHGVIKPPKAYKSIQEKLNILKSLIHEFI
jgi:hypothetical protein